MFQDRRERNQSIIRAQGGPGQVVARKLLSCRTTKDFLIFAKSNGVVVSKGKGDRVKLSLNGVSTFLAGMGRKTELMNSDRKVMIEDFKAMGIAWEKE